MSAAAGIAARRGGVQGRGPARRLAMLALLVLALAGAVELGRGLYIPAKAVVAQLLLGRAWLASRASGAPVKAWSWADAAPVAKLTMPRLGVEQVVLDGGSGEALAFAPTLVPGGAAPGERGLAVIAAHRDTHFTFLREVMLGDRIEVETLDGRVHAFRIVERRVMRHDELPADRGGAPRLALSTCYPFDGPPGTPLRFVVFAEPVLP